MLPQVTVKAYAGKFDKRSRNTEGNAGMEFVIRSPLVATTKKGHPNSNTDEGPKDSPKDALKNLSPFWAVMTASTAGAHNMEIVQMVFSVPCAEAVQKYPKLTKKVSVEIPILRNNKYIEAGHELLLPCGDS